MADLVRVRRFGAVAAVIIDNPPVNALSGPVRRAFAEALPRLDADHAVSAVVVACAGRTFVAGADISEFGKPPSEPTLPQVFAVVEEMGKPVVAAVHGTALGGGLELALACHYRVASPSASMGLPEVKLGLVPGGGGTQRLPRLIPAARALELILSGESAGAGEALRLGIVDRLVDGDLLSGAVACALELAVSGAPLRLASALPPISGELPEGYFDCVRAKLAKERRGLLAPLKAVECVEAAVSLPFAEGQEVERAAFAECRNSPQSAALRHVFFATREASRPVGAERDAAPREVSRVGVVGAGRMGAAIAMALADAGFPVALWDSDPASLARGMEAVTANCDALVRRGKIGEAEGALRKGLVSPVGGMRDLAECDLVIEAAFEDFCVKAALMEELDRILKPGALIATNTSSLNVDELAARTSRPADVLGLHFFNPANVMKLLEIVKGRETSAGAVAAGFALAKRMGKVGVLSGVAFGFIGNRMLAHYTSEVCLMLLEGVAPERIDAAMTGFGFAMGPNAVADLIGLDVRLGVLAEARRNGLWAISRWPWAVYSELAAAGRLGRKSGAGVYRYPEGAARGEVDPEALELIRSAARKEGVAGREVGDPEIVERCLLQLVNSGAALLADGIARRPGDVDVVWVNGYGFPVHEGGPLYRARVMGVGAVGEAMGRYRLRYGEAQWAKVDVKTVES